MSRQAWSAEEMSIGFRKLAARVSEWEQRGVVRKNERLPLWQWFELARDELQVRPAVAAERESVPCAPRS